jgi:phospholipid N-methyltransferase
MSALVFMKEAVISFRQLGTFLPTQSNLARSMARSLPHRSGMKIVELGAGEGSITRAIVHELGEIDYQLLVIEPNENLLTANQQSIHSGTRLDFLPADAFSLGRILDDRRISPVDAIVSSLPLFYFSPVQRRDLFALVKDRLAREGMFIQYRYTPAGVRELQPFFSRIHRRFVPHLFPAWLFICANGALVTR